jgi:hypothetical protein
VASIRILSKSLFGLRAPIDGWMRTTYLDQSVSRKEFVANPTATLILDQEFVQMLFMKYKDAILSRETFESKWMSVSGFCPLLLPSRYSVRVFRKEKDIFKPYVFGLSLGVI